MMIIESRNKSTDNRQPQHLSTCSCCGNSSWTHSGEQSYPAKYAQAKSFKAGLDSGLYLWNADGSKFGVDLFDCDGCTATFPDSK